jgi:predicted unusual protein kinase regulating ubiquinone biosynthesis (AarF/ABC1/UbiB family)
MQTGTRQDILGVHYVFNNTHNTWMTEAWLYIYCLPDYMSSLYGISEGSVEMENARHEVHLRNAERLKNLCFKNGGIYIKLGQHIGQLVKLIVTHSRDCYPCQDYLVPREFVQTMRNSTLNKCPIQTFAQVRDVFLAELGLYPSEVCSACSLSYASVFCFLPTCQKRLDLVGMMGCAWVLLKMHYG